MEANKIKTILLDWGHTFTGSGFSDAESEADKLLKPYGLSWNDFYYYYSNLYILRSQGRILTDSEMESQIKKLLGKDIPLIKIIDIIISSHIIPQENIDIVKELKKDYKVGLLSNNVKEWIEKALDNHKISGLFDGVIVSSEVGARKPDARIYLAALKKFSVKPEETVFVADEIGEDLVGAKGCGLKTVWLDSGVENQWKQSEREISEWFRPDATIKELKDVIQAIKTI